MQVICVDDVIPCNALRVFMMQITTCGQQASTHTNNNEITTSCYMVLYVVFGAHSYPCPPLVLRVKQEQVSSSPASKRLNQVSEQAMPFLRSHCSLTAGTVPLRAGPSRCGNTLGKRVCGPHLCPTVFRSTRGPSAQKEHGGARVDILYPPPARHAAIFSGHSPVAPGL